MNKLEKTLTSNEVAEMLGTTNGELMKSIRTYIGYLAEGEIPSGVFFIESTYRDSNNQDRPNYLLTKRGCEMVSNKLTGKKGVQFTAKYVDRFNEMEEHIKEQTLQIPQSPQQALRLMFQYQEDTTERVDAIENDVDNLKNNQLLTEPDYRTISSMVRNKIRIICTQQNLNNKAKAELFKDLNGGIKRITGAVARNRIKSKQFDEVIEFINNWMPSTATMTIIRQMELLDDE